MDRFGHLRIPSIDFIVPSDTCVEAYKRFTVNDLNYMLPKVYDNFLEYYGKQYRGRFTLVPMDKLIVTIYGYTPIDGIGAFLNKYKEFNLLEH